MSNKVALHRTSPLAPPAEIPVAPAAPSSAAAAPIEVSRGARAIAEASRGSARAATPKPSSLVGLRVAQQPKQADRAQASVAKNHSTFTRSRDLPAYLRIFDGRTADGKPGALARRLEVLGRTPGAHWLDSGGGEGLATEEMLKDASLGALNATLVSFQSSAASSARRNVLSGRFLEDIPDAELPKSDLITDLYGPLAYSARPHEVLKKYVGALKDDGQLFLFLGTGGDHYGRTNKVATRDGKLVDFGIWLESIPGISVALEKRPLYDLDDVIGEVWMAVVTKKPGEEAVIPELENIYFREGVQARGEMVPRMVFAEKGARPIAGAALEAASREAAEAFGRAAGAGSASSYLDAFRSGGISNPLLSSLTRMKDGDLWVSTGPTAARAGEDLAAGKVDFDDPAFLKAAQWLMGVRTRLARPEQLAYRSTDALAERPRSARLVTDHGGEFLAGYRPDQALARYFEGLRDDGEIYLSLGLESGGAGTSTQILTSSGEKVGLREWLASIPGLSVSDYRGHKVIEEPRKCVHEENVFVRIRIEDRARIRIPALDLVGLGAPSAEGVAVPLFRERADRATSPSAG